MNLDMLRSFLLCCGIINYGMLLIWAVLFMLPHDWLYRFHGKFFRISAEQIDAMNYFLIVLFKLGIFLFNLVPFVALCIVK